MKKLVLVLLLAIPLFAQDAPPVPPVVPIPTPRQWGNPDVLAEIGQLHIQVKQYEEYITVLRAKITELQAENVKLKEKK